MSSRDRAPEPSPRPGRQPGRHDLFLKDWITIWQSELSAAATDREVQEGWQTIVKMWANAAEAMVDQFASLQQAPTVHSPAGTADERPAAARTADPARPPAVAAAPGPRNDADAAGQVERLSRRIEDLERRLAEFERRRHR